MKTNDELYNVVKDILNEDYSNTTFTSQLYEMFSKDDDCNPKTEVWHDSREEKNLKLYKREPEEKQTAEIKSTKEAEEIINFIKDCFDKLKQNFHGYCLDINWKYYEAALEVLRPEYSSYQQGFNAGYEEGYLSRKRVEKEFVEEIKGYLDELKDVNIDEEE